MNPTSVSEEAALPTGTVTFLFTDIEGSTRLVEELGSDYPPLLDAHDELVEAAVRAGRGVHLGQEGDSHFAVFADAKSAVEATIEIQRALLSEDWPEGADIRVRIGLHTGEGLLGGTNYVGLDVHRAARISAAAHGGQTVVSEATALAVEHALDPDVRLMDLGKHRLKDLSEPVAIFQVWAKGLPREFPALHTLDSIPNNLPVQLSRFVGREELVSQAIALLDKSRLLTLTGSGGTGKTRLALQVAAEASASFPDGVFFVGLSSLSDPELVSSSVLAAIGVQVPAGASSPDEYLVEQLRGRELLLLMDNFEHLLEARQLVREILQRAPKARLLVTSRAPLRMTGEQELPVPPMETAAFDRDMSTEQLEEVEAIRLFLDLAKSTRPDFHLTDENAEAVVRLVNRLDGLPLAIELVASRIRMLDVGSILERLDSQLLRSTSADLPERQRTIETAIGWSYDLLNQDARRLFQWLSVFAGGSRYQEIEDLIDQSGEEIGDLLGALESLVDQSLVMAREGIGGPRFRMLHVIREFATARLGDSGQVDLARDIHCKVYTLFAEDLAPRLLGADRRKWLDAMEEDHDNLRSALDWGIGRKVDTTLRLAASCWRFWQARGHLHEAAGRIDDVLAQDGGSPAAIAGAIEAKGGVQWWQGAMAECLETYRDLLARNRELGDERGIANALFNVALATVFSGGDFAGASALLDEGEVIYRRLGDVNGLGDIYWARGDGSMLDEDADMTVEHMTRAVEYYGQSGNEFGRGWAQFNIASALVRDDRVETAWPYVVDSLTLFASHRDLSAITLLLAVAAEAAAFAEDRPRALRLLGALHALRMSTGTDIVTVEFNVAPGFEFENLEKLSGNDAEIYAAGKTMTADDAVEFALDWSPGP